MEMHKISPLKPSPVTSELAETVGARLRNEYDRGFIYGENVGMSRAMASIKQVEDRALWAGITIGGAIGSVVTATVILWGMPS